MFINRPPRKHQIIPATPEVCALRSALSSRFDRPHSLYVAHPRVVGPQPCVVVFNDGATPTSDFALVAVPYKAPLGLPYEDEILGRKLSLLNHLYKPRLSEAQKEWKAGPLQHHGIEAAPFGHVHWYRLLKAVYSFVGTAEASKRALPAHLRKALASLNDTAERLRESWEPLVLYVPSAVEQEQMWDNWFLLEHWPEWERIKVSPTKRLRKFLDFRQKPLPCHPRQLRQEMNTFRHRWRFLRLKCSAKSGANWRKRLWDMWLCEETK